MFVHIYNTLWKSLNKLFDQPNTYIYTYTSKIVSEITHIQANHTHRHISLTQKPMGRAPRQ